MRDAWTIIEATWSATTEHARALPEVLVQARVDDEWSFVETLRHLVFVTDAWVRRTILGEPHPYDRLALPPDADVDVRAWGIDMSSKASFADVLTVRLDRMATVKRVVDELTPGSLARLGAQHPDPGFPPVTTLPAGMCLNVVISEEWAHHQYAVRDLARLEAPGA